MIIPTKVDPATFGELVSHVGGVRLAARIIGVPRRDVERWQADANAPQVVMKLLWLASPAGRFAHDAEAHSIVTLTRAQNESLHSTVASLKAELKARVATHQAEVQCLRSEVTRLRGLLELPSLSGVLRRIARELQFIADATDIVRPAACHARDRSER